MTDYEPQNKPRSGDGQTSSLNAKAVALSGLAILMAALVCMGISAVIFAGFGAREDEPPGALPRDAVKSLPQEGPRLQVHPKYDYRVFAETQEKELNSYGWIDRREGRVHVPIDRAMENLLRNGLPNVGGSVTRTMLRQNRAAQPSDLEERQ